MKSNLFKGSEQSYPRYKPPNYIALAFHSCQTPPVQEVIFTEHWQETRQGQRSKSGVSLGFSNAREPFYDPFQTLVWVYAVLKKSQDFFLLYTI